MKLYPYVITGPVLLPFVDYLLTKVALAAEQKKSARAAEALNRLEQLHHLLKLGVITEAEFKELKELLTNPKNFK